VQEGGNMNKQLTDEQIENWRKILVGIIGPYALLMPIEKIIAFRDNLQSFVDEKKINKSLRSKETE
jgi:hypothetical protein